MEEELNGKPQVTTNDDKQLWREVQSMHVPRKVKMLLWCACRDAMPTKNVLFHRTISADPFSVKCHASLETSLHALQSCLELDSVWSDINLWSFHALAQFVTFKELLSWLIKNNHQLELFVVTAWTIQNERNRVHLNQPTDSFHQLPYFSNTWLANYQARQVIPATPVHQHRRPRNHWSTPPLELFKINFDGAVFPHDTTTKCIFSDKNQ